MIVYYFVFLLTLVLSFLLPSNSDKQWRWKLFWTFIPLFLLGALRVNFGNDYDSYENFFYEFHTERFIYDENSHAEFGYQLLNFVLPSFRSLLVLNSFLLCFSLALFIYRNVPKEYFWLAIILIFFNIEKNIYGSLVATRNGFAVATFLIGSIFVQRRNIILFAATTIVAISFHSSAIFYMPIAYIAGLTRELDKKEIVIWLLVVAFLLLSSLSGLMSYVEPFLVDEYETYRIYISDEWHRGWLLTLAGLLLFGIILLLFWRNKSSFTSKQNSLIRLGLLYTISTLLGSMAYRAGYFYDMFFIATVVLLVSRIKSNKTLIRFLCILSISMSIYSFYLWRTNCIGNPRYDVYQSVLDDVF